MTNDCKTCPVSTGTHKPAEALHQQIDEPAAPVGKPIEDAIDALVMAAFTEGGCSEHRMSEARIQTELRKKELRTLLSTPQPCSRSHPHEEMTHMCELRTEIARLTNALARAEALLAAAQQGVQAAVPTDDELTMAWIAAGGVFFGPNTPTGSMPEAKLFPFLRQLAATHPTKQGLADDGLYYLQDARWSGMVGNCPSFWREGGGYTTNLDEAERFTLDAAMKQHKCRETDLPWLCSEVDKLRRPTVDCQYMPRSWDAQRAALAAQAKQGGA